MLDLFPENCLKRVILQKSNILLYLKPIKYITYHIYLLRMLIKNFFFKFQLFFIYLYDSTLVSLTKYRRFDLNNYRNV